MDCPRNTTELRMFIGCVNYYRDMWPSCAHILKPLTDQSGLKYWAPIKWTDEMQQAFDRMRLLMAANALAAYPDHNKRFDVYTDASDIQLGACIIQEGRPVAYFLWIYSNPFRFPISSLVLPNIPSQEGWEGGLVKYTADTWTSTRQILESYNHFFLIKYFITKAIYSFLHLAFSILHQPPTRSPTRVYFINTVFPNNAAEQER